MAKNFLACQRQVGWSLACHVMVDLYTILYNVHVHVWKQIISELSGVTAGTQENLSSSQMVELRFES